MPDVLIRGLEGVVVAQSSKSKVYGEEGRLIYGGYAIEDLAEHVTFEEVIHLLWYGELPSVAKLAALKAELAALRAVPDGALTVLRDLPMSAHPMSVLRTLVSTLGCLDNADAEAAAHDEAARWRCAKRLVAQLPTLIAVHERHRRGLPILAPRSDLDHAANFLYSGVEPGRRRCARWTPTWCCWPTWPAPARSRRA
ncbi:MAG: citrate/2-methylcitrate synthase [Anaerolineae bacterium]